MTGRFLTTVAITAVIVIGWSCGDPSGQGNGCASTGADVIINAQDNLTFDKPSLTITRGQRVCWQNPGSTAHTVTATSASPADPSWTDSTFDATLNPGGVAIHTFSTAGLYQYRCRLHTGMTGSVNVP